MPPTNPPTTPAAINLPAIITLGYFAYDHIDNLRFFRAVGEVMLDGEHLSFRAASEELRTRAIPDIPTGVNAISRLSDCLAPLFQRVFGKAIQLFRLPTREGWPVQGLSDDGLVAHRMTCEYLDEIERSLGLARG